MGASINDGICFDLHVTSLTYPGVEDAVALISLAGHDALIPVHPDDQALSAIRWEGARYLDTALPFGLCSASKIFAAMTDGLSWCMLVAL